MKPIVLALIAVWPLQSLSQAGLRVAAPPAAKVPVPVLAGWRSDKQGVGAPVNSANSRGGIDQIIVQALAREIYNWQSFDIGANSSVEYRLPSVGSAALNRVGGTAPSLIFGSLKSTIPNPKFSAGGTQPERIVGGDIYLLNGNGILFGPNARVDVGSLVASSLNVDNDDFLNGLTNSIYGQSPSFARDSVLSVGTARGFVEVSAGATITTPSGGRVFLFAEDVSNAGRIETPGGQTVLAAGEQVYLQAPTVEKLYASEINANVPAVRGLLVEVGTGRGRVDQLGEIVSNRGNTTLVGMAVNQQGRISASTSVSENGSVFLLARGEAKAISGADITKRATVGGALTLGPQSVASITPDDTTTTSTGSSFTASRIEMSARTIDLQGQVTAPGAQVRLRSEKTPDYELPSSAPSALSAPDLSRAERTFDAEARISVAAGAVIDLAGTTDTVVSAARNYVTTELLGGNDLKDAPLQKDGPLYRARVTFDLRAASPILGDTSSYKSNTPKTAVERMAAGGSLLLESTGQVSTAARSTLSVAGGQVAYTAAIVRPSALTASDGSVYTLNTAPATLAYVGLSDASYKLYGRWGTVPGFRASSSGQTAAGYVEGQAAGTVRVLARQALLDGSFKAATVAGDRQRAGQDAVAVGGSFQLGQTGVLGTGVDSRIVLVGQPSSPRDGQTLIAASALQASGFGRITLASDQGISSEAGATLNLAERSSLNLYSRAPEGISLAADIHSAGGSLTVQTVDHSQRTSLAGDIRVADGVQLDVAGRILNQERDGTAVTGSAAGGRVALQSGRGLVIGTAALLDVSGGATVRTNGAVVAGNAGAILLSNSVISGQSSAFELGGSLRGFGLNSGGSLSVRAGDVVIGATDGVAAPTALSLGSEFFSQGGFERFDIDGVLSLKVTAGTVIAPILQSRLSDTLALRAAASGSLLSAVSGLAVQDAVLRRPVNLSLQSSGQAAVADSGLLTLEIGAQINLEPAASLVLRGGQGVQMGGQIRTAGGKVTVEQTGSVGGTGAQDALRLGAASAIDVSGRLLPALSSDGLSRGRVLDGGTVTLSATTLDWAAGSVVRANGSTALLDAAASGPAFPEGRQPIASAAGSLAVNIEVNGGRDSLLAGRFEAAAPTGAQAAGRLSIAMRKTDSAAGIAAHRLLVLPGQAKAGELPGIKTVSVGSELLGGSLADLSLTSLNSVVLGGDLNLAATRRLSLDTPLLQLLPDARVDVRAASVSLGNSGVAASTAPQGGNATLTASASGLNLDLIGALQIDGARSVALASAGDLRMNGVLANGGNVGSLTVPADLSLAAAQIYGRTASAFSVDAIGHQLRIGRVVDGAPVPAAPLSAGASLLFKAQDIVQDGVLRAPLGSLSLKADRSLTLTPQSLTAVSGDGLLVPFGATVGGTDWFYGSQGSLLTSLPAKQIDLGAASLALASSATQKATLDLSGGGALQALEFVAGPGGSNDIFAGAANGAFAIVPGGAALAPLDNHIAQLTDASGAVVAIPAGRQLLLARDLSFGSAVLKAGTYAVLPARYAVLPGSYLVSPSSQTVSRNTALLQDNGALLAGAAFSSAGTVIADSRPSAFVFTPTVIARKSSEIRTTAADAYFGSRAARDGLATPAAAIDAGALNLSAQQQLTLAASLRFAHAAAAGAGALSIAAPRLAVSDNAAAHPDELVLSATELNASGAGSLLLGGVRSRDAKGQNVAVAQSQSVTVDAGSVALSAADITLLASQRVALADGAALNASASLGSRALETLHVSGDGASLRLSSTASSLVRSALPTAASGALLIGANTQLSAGSSSSGSLSLEAAGRTQLDGTAVLQAAAMSIGAGQIVIGDAAGPADGTALHLSAAQIDRLGVNRQSLQLRSYSDIQFAAGIQLGGAGLQSLILDAPALTGAGDAAASAQQLQWLNSSGLVLAATPAVGSGSLSLSALGGDLTLGPGALTVRGGALLSLQAQRDLVLVGQGGLSTAGDLRVQSNRIAAGQSAKQSLTAGGVVRTLRNASSAMPSASSGMGAQVALSGRELVLGGLIDLPSGQLSLQSQGDLSFQSTATTSVRGLGTPFDGQMVATPGGSIKANSSAGNLQVVAGAVIDVGGADKAAGGSLALSAASGELRLNGKLSGSASSLSLDSRKPVDLAALAQQLGSGTQFGQAVSVRNREGDQTLAAGVVLRAASLALASDLGRLDVFGELHADAPRGAQISLASGGDLGVHGGALLSASNTAAAADGGEIRFSTSAGQMRLEEGASLVTPGGAGGRDGTVKLRVPRTGVSDENPGGTGVALDALRASFAAVRAIQVEAVRRYDGVEVISETGTLAPTATPTVAPTTAPTPAPTPAPTVAPSPNP
ncbi:MAG: filamentous hemagglutinin N-terminal domain-containing protein, partial [Microbacteriaceae bacterium]|nr:filamentous hemagglutinin N-terminal domain-containing protein [Burkholderiaceae bacterium]